MTSLFNAMPHPAHIHTPQGIVTIPPSGQVARVVLAEPVPVNPVELNGRQVPVWTTSTTGTVTGLPDQMPDTLILVSRMVAEAAPDRTDLVITHDAVRDANGHIIGVRGLARIQP